MRKIYLDTNVILDFLLNRDGFADMMTIFQWGSLKRIRLYCSILSIADAYFVLRKSVGKEKALRGINILASRVNVLPMSDMTLYSVIRNCGADFEDSLQIYCAQESLCDLLITRNTRHFKEADIPVFTPASFVEACQSF